MDLKELERLRNERDELKYRLQAWKDIDDGALLEAIACGREAERLKWEARVAELERDKARLEWIFANCEVSYGGPEKWIEDMDELDAAMQETKA